MTATLAGKTGDKIIIRRLYGNDLNELPALYSRHLYNPDSFEVSLSFTDPVAWAQKVCRRLYIQYVFDKPLSVLGLETCVCAVAQTKDGNIIGTVVARRKYPSAETWRIGNVVVHANYRRLGIATRMMSFVISHLKRKRAKEAWLIVESNSVARRLYEKIGFKYSGSLFVSYGHTQDLTIERSSQRSGAHLHVRRISSRPPNEDFLRFWFERIVSVFLCFFFKELPRIETFALMREGKMIGFLKVDNSKFRSTAIVREIYLHPEFRERNVIKEAVTAVLEILRSSGIEKVLFQVFRTSIDRLLLRNILLELNLRTARVYNFMSKEL